MLLNFSERATELALVATVNPKDGGKLSWSLTPAEQGVQLIHHLQWVYRPNLMSNISGYCGAFVIDCAHIEIYQILETNSIQNNHCGFSLTRHYHYHTDIRTPV